MDKCIPCYHCGHPLTLDNVKSIDGKALKYCAECLDNIYSEDIVLTEKEQEFLDNYNILHPKSEPVNQPSELEAFKKALAAFVEEEGVVVYGKLTSHMNKNYVAMLEALVKWVKDNKKWDECSEFHSLIEVWITEDIAPTSDDLMAIAGIDTVEALQEYQSKERYIYTSAMATSEYMIEAFLKIAVYIKLNLIWNGKWEAK